MPIKLYIFIKLYYIVLYIGKLNLKLYIYSPLVGHMCVICVFIAPTEGKVRCFYFVEAESHATRTCCVNKTGLELRTLRHQFPWCHDNKHVL